MQEHGRWHSYGHAVDLIIRILNANVIKSIVSPIMLLSQKEDSQKEK